MIEESKLDYAMNMMEPPMRIHVLLVANCSDPQEFLKDYLHRQCSFEVTAVSDTLKALELATAHKEMFDILIVNIDPVLMKKFQLLQFVHIVKILPVITLSQSHDGTIIMKAYSKGATRHWINPIQLEDLKNIWTFVRKPNYTNIAQNNNTSSKHKDPKCEGPKNKDLNRKIDRKRDEPNEPRDKEQHKGKGDANLVPQKKPRLVWTEELKSKFRYAVDMIGIEVATPKKILEIMKVPYITRDNVASHLQKYRNTLEKMNAINKKRMAKTMTSMNSMMPMEPRSNRKCFIGPNHSSAPIRFMPQGLLDKPETNINMSRGGIPTNISGDHLVYPLNSNTFHNEIKLSNPCPPMLAERLDHQHMFHQRQLQVNETINSFYSPTLPQRLDQPIEVPPPRAQPNEAYLQQVPHSRFVYDSSTGDASPFALPRELPMPKETNVFAPFGYQVLPSQEELAGIKEPRNDMMMSLNSGLDCDFLQITNYNEMPSIELSTLPITAKSGLESYMEPQLQNQDVPAKAMPFQQVMQSSLGHFYEDPTENGCLEPQLQYEHVPINATPLIKGPSEQEDQLKQLVPNASKHFCKHSMNNGPLEPQLQCQDSQIENPPSVRTQPEGWQELLYTPNNLDSYDHSTNESLQPDDSSLDGSFFLPACEGYGGDDKFAEETLKLISEMGSPLQTEQINMTSMDFDF